MKHTTIAIIGIGNVGASTAFALLLSNNVSEIILVDICAEKSMGEALDLTDARAFSSTSCIRQGTYADACRADIVIITAGHPQQPAQSRPELLAANKEILKEICTQLRDISQDTLVIIVTNPLDAMTYYAQQWLPLDKNRVFGTGTWLDTQRLRSLLATRFSVSPHSIEAFMIGEHGDSAVALVPDYFNLSSQEISDLQAAVIKQAYTIIDLKCATYYGIAACISDICTAVIYNQRRVLPLSTYHEKYGICISTPVIVGGNGIEGNVNLTFSAEQQALLEKSVQEVKNTLSA